MKKIITTVILLFIIGLGHSQDKEKRIKFNKGTLKICSNSHMTIKGYDGDEVVIKSLNNKLHYSYKQLKGSNGFKLKSSDSSKVVKGYRLLNAYYNEEELEKGLKPLGSKSTNPEDNLYLDITENPGELIIRDYGHTASNKKGKSKVHGRSFYITGKNDKNRKHIGGISSNFFYTNNKYEILIPNSIKLSWNVEDCEKKNSNTFIVRTDSNPWELADFEGEVEISTSYNSVKLTDVSGPVIANTIGGNIKVIFDDIKPTKLYSLVSNDGYIDITLPTDADINVDASGDRILSDIDFKVVSDNIVNGIKDMELQLNSGKTKMKLDAGAGNVYLRKQE